MQKSQIETMMREAGLSGTYVWGPHDIGALDRPSALPTGAHRYTLRADHPTLGYVTTDVACAASPSEYETAINNLASTLSTAAASSPAESRGGS